MKFRKNRKLFFFSIISIIWVSTIVDPAVANAAPTITITSPANGATVSGKVTLNATAAVDPVGTATLRRAGLSINGVSEYYPYLNDVSYSSGYRFGSLGTADYEWSTTQGSYSFVFDTTSWQSGSYKVTVFTDDTNGRAAASSVTITVPVLPVLVLSLTKTSGATSYLSTQIQGTASLYSGNVILESGAGPDGPWTAEGIFTGSIDSLVLPSQLPFGTWVRTSLSGVAELRDSVSKPIQLIGNPSIKCTLPSSIKINAVLKGSCISDISLNRTRVTLQANFGSGWSNLGSSTVTGTAFPISIAVKRAGTFSVRVVSTAQKGLLSSSISKISKIAVNGL